MGVVLLDPNRGLQRELVGTLEDILLHARRPGGPISMAYVLTRAGRQYSVGLAGAARRCPIEATFARGQIRTLDDELAMIIRALTAPPPWK